MISLSGIVAQPAFEPSMYTAEELGYFLSKE